MATYNFGAGNLYAAAAVNGVTNSLKFGTLQEFSLDFSATFKELYGQQSFAVSIAKGQTKVSGKAKAAAISAKLWNQVYFGQAASAGQTLTQVGEVGTQASNGGQILLANGATLVDVLSVTRADTGAPLTRVGGGAGQVSALSAGPGVYISPGTVAGSILCSGDLVGVPLLIDYTYTVTSGTTLALANQQTGVAPSFKLTSGFQYDGKAATLILNRVYAPKLSLAFKNEDFTVPEFDFMMSADASGNVGIISLAE